MQLDLASVHKAKTKALGPLELSKKREHVKRHSKGGNLKDPFADAVRRIDGTSSVALLEAFEAIEATLETIHFMGPTAAVEERLLIAETTLSSASAALKEMLGMLTAAENGVLKKTPQLTDVVEHYRHLIVCLVDQVAARRVEVGLAREECAAYTAEMLKNHQCGVLCAPIDTIAPSNTLDAEGEAVGSRMKRGVLASDSDSGRVSEVVSRGGKAATAAFAAAVYSFQGHTQAVSSLTSRFAEETSKLLVSGGAKDSTDDVSHSLDHDAPAMPSYHFSDQETATFEVQGELLLERQHVAEAAAAKEIEQSVSQLSQLNSLVGEHVFAQGEQVALLERNTEQSKAHLKQAAKELEKPLKDTLNSSRMFVLFVWANILLLLAAHWVIR